MPQGSADHRPSAGIAGAAQLSKPAATPRAARPPADRVAGCDHLLGSWPAAELADRTAAELMITCPKTLPVDTTLEHARAAFNDPHVHMLLLADNGVLHGTLLRTDLLTPAPPTSRALPLASLTGRVTAPEARIAAIHESLARSERRLAVVDTTNRLLGMLCLKRHQRGFCTDQGVFARARERTLGKPMP